MCLKIPNLRRFFTFSPLEQKLLVKAFLLLVVVRLGLWLLPFKTLQRILVRLFPDPVSPHEPILPLMTISWAVVAASSLVPSSTCLTQALTLRALLARDGIHSDLALGVSRDEESQFIAHAWLEIDGRVIIGGGERDRYTRLTNKQNVEKN